jgi:uncharacterized membrane protein YphA (DoxX/SURF4 family)
MKQLFLMGRLLLGGYLIYSGAHHFTAVTHLTEYAASKGLPVPMAAVLVSGMLLLLGGVTFLLGVAPRIGVAALVLFFVPVTLLMHAFWREQGPMRMADLTNFTKNIGLLGAVLMLAAVPEPWPYSVETRARLRREAEVH